MDFGEDALPTATFFRPGQGYVRFPPHPEGQHSFGAENLLRKNPREFQEVRFALLHRLLFAVAANGYGKLNQM